MAATAKASWQNEFEFDLVSTTTGIPTNSALLMDHLSGNYLVSDEPTDWRRIPTSSNQLSATDVNSSNHTSPIDALIVINYMNEHNDHKLPLILGGMRSKIESKFHLDVNDDGQITPLDALIVINELNDSLSQSD